MKFYQASFTSRHFHFDAFGSTETRAVNALISGLADHAKQYGIAAEWYSIDDFTVRRIDTGEAYRDGEPIKRANNDH